jgi:hypothetical protein
LQYKNGTPQPWTSDGPKKNYEDRIGTVYVRIVRFKTVGGKTIKTEGRIKMDLDTFLIIACCVALVISSAFAWLGKKTLYVKYNKTGNVQPMPHRKGKRK